MATRKRRSGVEWVGGLVSMPAYVTGEGEPYRPEALFWMGAEGALLGSTMARPGEVLGLAVDSLRTAIEEPMFGRAHVPARVRVASPELAGALRAGHPAIEVVCAPTPELDVVLGALVEELGEGSEAARSYLSPGIDPDAVASFFRAAARLFRAKPWSIVPGDQNVFSVTIEALGLRDAAVSVIGQMDQSLGLILFSGIDDFEAYLDIADVVERGEVPSAPAHFALIFERGAELGAALGQEVAEHGWEVASADAYPSLAAVDADLVARPATAEELTVVEAIARALAEVLSEEEALRAAWNGGEPVARTLVVSTHAGDFEIALRVPYQSEPAEYRPPFDVLADLAELGKDGDEIDPEARGELEEELLAQFDASPEAKDLDDTGCCPLLMDFAASHFGATIATLEPAELREIVFEIIPRKVSVPASAAAEIIEELRAFYAFLARAFGLRQAGACLRVLDRGAVAKLEAALSDTSDFGIAKSLVMAGREAGFDIDTPEGIEAWLRASGSNALLAAARAPISGGPARRPDPAAARAKRNQRKAARNARKRNR